MAYHIPSRYHNFWKVGDGGVTGFWLGLKPIFVAEFEKTKIGLLSGFTTGLTYEVGWFNVDNLFFKIGSIACFLAPAYGNSNGAMMIDHGF